MSIDPSTKNANSTQIAGTQSAGVRRKAETENAVAVPSGPRSRGAVRRFQTAVRKSASVA